MSKIYVDVLAEFTKDGILKPKEIIMIKGLIIIAFSILIAMIVGKSVQKFKLPAILGWLI